MISGGASNSRERGELVRVNVGYVAINRVRGMGAHERVACDRAGLPYSYRRGERCRCGRQQLRFLECFSNAGEKGG